MDLFNKIKLKEQEKEIKRLKYDLDETLKEVKKLKAIIAGDRVCGHHCSRCKNGYEEIIFHENGLWSYVWRCKLTIKCKDFKERGKTE